LGLYTNAEAYRSPASVSSDRILIRNNFSSIELKYDGEFRLSDDDKDIVSITPNGYFKISKTTFGNKRSIQIDSDHRGNLTKKYYEGRTELSYVPDGEEWLADVLPEIVRSSAIAVEQRVERIYGKSGAQGVIQEIEEIDSDYLSAIYFDQLLAVDNLTSAELQQIAIGIGSELDSDYESAKVLVKNYDVFSKDPEASTAYFAALLDMDSDFERAKVIMNVSGKSVFTHENVVQITQVLLDMDSDYERGRIITTLAKEVRLSDADIITLARALMDMDSDYERAKTIKAIAEYITLNKESLNSIFMVMMDMDSDFERSKSIGYLAENQNFDMTNQANIGKLIMEMDSDFEKSKIVKTVMEEEVVTNIGVLAPGINNMSSSFDKSKSISYMVNYVDMDVENSLALIRMAAGIDSDHDKVKILNMIADEMPDDERIKEAFLEAAKTISSDTSYGKLVRRMAG